MKAFLLICCLIAGLTMTGHAQTYQPVGNPETKAKELQKELNLSANQIKRITVIYRESFVKFNKIKAADDGDTNKMLADIAPLCTVTVKKIKAVLSRSQLIKYDELTKRANNTITSLGWTDSEDLKGLDK